MTVSDGPSGVSYTPPTPIPVGTLAHVGSAVLDFGATPDDYATVDITGQDSVAIGSHIRVWFQGSSTEDNTADDHVLAGATTRLATTSPTLGVGFTIYCMGKIGLWTGKLNVEWVWS